MFGLQGPEAYAYTSLSNCLEVQDMDDVHDYHDTIVRNKKVSLDFSNILSESYANNRPEQSRAK